VRRRWDIATWLLAVCGVLMILLLATMWLYPILLAPSCEPVFPDLQLPTMSGVRG
jgi:hypothetical protein